MKDTKRPSMMESSGEEEEAGGGEAEEGRTDSERVGGGSKSSVEAWLKVKYLVREKEGLSQRREEEKGRRV